MRLAFLLLVLTVTAMRAQDWRKMYSELPETPLKKQPEVTVLSATPESVTIRVKNVGGTNLCYNQIEGSEPSLYWEEKILGCWQGTDWPWCGTCQGVRFISPGETCDFSISLQEKRNAFRVYVHLSDRLAEEASFVLLYERGAAGK